MVARIKRTRWMLMRYNRTEVWGGSSGYSRFQVWPNVGSFAIKTFSTKQKALGYAHRSRLDDYEAVEIVETLDIVGG